MKKAVISVVTLLTIIMVVACGTKSSTDQTPTKSSLPLTAEYYPLKGSHIDLSCGDCHEDVTYEARVTQEQCFDCHGDYTELAQLTEYLGYDDNIHASPHYPKMDCDLCHRVHTPTATKTNYCAMCHSQPEMEALVVP